LKDFFVSQNVNSLQKCLISVRRQYNADRLTGSGDSDRGIILFLGLQNFENVSFYSCYR
jgi:hypothetical protein